MEVKSLRIWVSKGKECDFKLWSGSVLLLLRWAAKRCRGGSGVTAMLLVCAAAVCVSAVKST